MKYWPLLRSTSVECLDANTMAQKVSSVETSLTAAPSFLHVIASSVLSAIVEIVASLTVILHACIVRLQLPDGSGGYRKHHDGRHTGQ